MAYEQKDNSGALFANDKREKETHANAKGSALIDGVEYWVDAWTNTAQNGSKYQSLKFKRKDARQEGPRQQSGGNNNFPTDNVGGSGFADDDYAPF